MRQEVFKAYVGATSGVFGVPTWLPLKLIHKSKAPWQ